SAEQHSPQSPVRTLTIDSRTSRNIIRTLVKVYRGRDIADALQIKKAAETKTKAAAAQVPIVPNPEAAHNTTLTPVTIEFLAARPPTPVAAPLVHHTTACCHCSDCCTNVKCDWKCCSWSCSNSSRVSRADNNQV